MMLIATIPTLHLARCLRIWLDLLKPSFGHSHTVPKYHHCRWVKGQSRGFLSVKLTRTYTSATMAFAPDSSDLLQGEDTSDLEMDGIALLGTSKMILLIISMMLVSRFAALLAKRVADRLRRLTEAPDP